MSMGGGCSLEAQVLFPRGPQPSLLCWCRPHGGENWNVPAITSLSLLADRPCSDLFAIIVRLPQGRRRTATHGSLVSCKWLSYHSSPSFSSPEKEG